MSPALLVKACDGAGVAVALLAKACDGAGVAVTLAAPLDSMGNPRSASPVGVQDNNCC